MQQQTLNDKLQPDFVILDEGTIFLLTPLSDAARTWVYEYLPEDRQWFGHGVVVEHRYIADIIKGITSDCLEVRPEDGRTRR